MNHRSTKIDHSFIDKHKGSLCMTAPVPPNTGESANQSHLSALGSNQYFQLDHLPRN